MDLISWSDFLNLKDTTPIDEAVKKIENLQDSFKSAVDSIAKDSARLGGEYAILVSEAKNMLDQMGKLTQAQKQSQEQVVAAAKGAESLATATKANTDAQKAATKATEDLTAAEKTAQGAKDALLKGQSVELGSLDALKAKLDAATKSYYAMGDATDGSIKEDQLKKIDDLSNQYIKQKKAVDDVKKSTQNAAGSYNELAAKVANAKNQLKNMEGGVKGTSAEFQALKKQVADGTKELKNWDAEIGDNQRDVGNYKKALDGLVPGFSGVTQAAEGTGKALWSLAANPVGLVILAIAAALALVTTWFTRTETGGDKLQEILGGLKGIVGFILDQLAVLGGALFKALSEPQKIIKALWEGLIVAKDAIVSFFSEPLPYIKALGQAIVDNIVTRFKGLVAIFTSTAKALQALYKGDFEGAKKATKELGDAVIQTAVGVEDGIKKIGNVVSNELTAKLKRAMDIGVQIARLKDKLEDQEIALIKSTAKAQLDSDALILKSKDKLRVSDEARYAAIKQVSKISENQMNAELSAAQTRLEIAKQDIAAKLLSLKLEEVPNDLIKAQAQAEADLMNIQDKRLNERVRLQKQEISIVKEIEADQIAAEKRLYDAQTNLAKAQSEIRAKRLAEFASDSKTELELRNVALKKITEEELAQAKITTDQQMKTAQEAALARIELDDQTLKKIYDDESKSITERIALERQMKLAKLDSDKSYVDETKRILETYYQATHDINNKLISDVKKNVFTQLKDDLDELTNDLKGQNAEQLNELNASFQAGMISATQYDQQRKQLNADTNKHLLESTIDYLEQKRKLLEQSGQDTSEIENQIAAARLQISQATTDQLLEYEKNLAAAKQELATQASASLGTIVDDQFAADQQRAQVKLQQLQDSMQKELDYAGDNEEAKKEIKNRYDALAAKQQQKENDSKKKQAIFDKGKAVFDIGIATATAIIKAVAASPLTGGLPFSAIAGAIGALQLAAVLAKPIPAFAGGTDSAPGGLALINEQGPELMVDQSGNAHIVNSDGPTYAFVGRGTRIYTADQTENIMNEPLAFQMATGLARDANALTVIAEQRHDERLASVFSEGIHSLERTIKRSSTGSLTTQDIKKAFREALDWKDHTDKFYR